MAAYLSKLILRNIQTHEHTVLDFPRTGVIRLRGDNSAGKSVVVRALGKIIGGEYIDPDNRREAIRRGASFGEVELTFLYDDAPDAYARVTVHLEKEASSSYYKIKTSWSKEEHTIRVSERKTIVDTMATLGFHYNQDKKFSLNIHQSLGPVFMITTDPKDDGEIFYNICTDQEAEGALVVAQEYLSTFNFQQELNNQEIKNLETQLSLLKEYDEVELAKDVERLRLVIPIVEGFNVKTIKTNLDLIVQLKTLIGLSPIIPETKNKDLESFANLKTQLLVSGIQPVKIQTTMKDFIQIKNELDVLGLNPVRILTKTACPDITNFKLLEAFKFIPAKLQNMFTDTISELDIHFDTLSGKCHYCGKEYL